MSDNNRIDFNLNFSVSKRVLSHTAAVLAGGLLFSAALAFADGDNSTQTVVGSDIIMPYDGYLMVDATPLTGVRTIKFDLYQDATGGTSVWTETQTVNLYNGRVSVGLGSSSSLTNTILDAEKLYLAMTIIDTDSQGNQIEVELSGRQSIEPAPFAAWAANSADFNVGGDLTVTGTATVGDDLTVSGDELKLGSNGKNALFHNANDQLYISPSKGHSGGVYVGNDFYTNYDTRLGPSDGSGYTRVFGPDSDGATQAALQIKMSDGSTMYLDDDDIDSDTSLNLQRNSGLAIGLFGHTHLYDHYLVMEDAAGDDYYFTAQDGSYDDTGVELRATNNPASGSPLFRVMSSGGSERLRVEHDGKLHTTNDFESDGDTTVGGDLTVNGNFTNFNLNIYSLNITGSNATGEKELEETGLDTSSNGTRTSFCFLMDVRFDDLDSDEFHTCTIDQSNDSSTGTKKWFLNAEINGGGGEIYCQAGCFSW